jgi:hypothetical protein
MRPSPWWARIISLFLLLITLGMLSYALILLIRAGQEAIGLAAAAIGVIIASLPILELWKGTKISLNNPKGTDQFMNWGLMLFSQGVTTLAVVIGASLILRIAADDLISKAVVATNFDEARTALNNAKILGTDVTDTLDTEFLLALDAPSTVEDDERVLDLARLYAGYITGDMLQNRAIDIQSRAYNAISRQDNAQARRFMQALALIDPRLAGATAREFYNLAIEAFASQPPQTTSALAYLDAFFAANGLVDTGVSNSEVSYGYLLHGQIVETRDISFAFTDYRQAISSDSANLEAYYALASGLLTQVENMETRYDPILLNDAIRTANIGREQIPESFCRGKQNLIESTIFRNSWYCFLLMTTEGGARVLRGSEEDTLRTINGLLQPAIDLAETNDHFGVGYFTAEAYYWYARISEPDPRTEEGYELFCNIILHLDRSKQRHTVWQNYANQQLDGRLCVP